MVLPRAFFNRPAPEVAPELLGCVLEHESGDGLVAVRLTEVEAYHGERDPASHAFRGKTARNAVMFGEPGHVYVYFTYGMHFCMNLVCESAGTASAVLVRAGEVVEGVDAAARRRGGSRPRDLARGPARLAKALAVDREVGGLDACDPASPLRVLSRAGAAPSVACGPRVGVASAADVKWRFWIDGDKTVSPYRRHAVRERTGGRHPGHEPRSPTKGARKWEPPRNRPGG